MGRAGPLAGPAAFQRRNPFVHQTTVPIWRMQKLSVR